MPKGVGYPNPGTKARGKKKDNVRKPVGDTPTAQQKLENLKNPFYKAPFSFPKPTKGFFKGPTKGFFKGPTKGIFDRKTPVDKDGNPLSLRQQEDRLRKSHANPGTKAREKRDYSNKRKK